jgi:hypothetical protein
MTDILRLPTSDEMHLQYVQVSRGITLASACKAPLIRDFVAKQDENTAVKLFMFLLVNFQDNLGVKEKLTDSAIFECADALMNGYPTETVEDVILCLKKAKSGEYGKFYNRISQADILDFFRKYLDEKAAYRESEHMDIKATAQAYSNREMTGKTRDDLPFRIGERYWTETGEYLPEGKKQDNSTLKN